ncbi:MAG: T9SS type A sorting domain-containing protein [Bacteroidota bacterium]
MTASGDLSNTWYRDDEEELVDPHGSTHLARADGFYKVEANVEECKTMSDAVQIKLPKVVTGVEDDESSPFTLTPNPATSFVKIGVPKSFKGEPVFMNTVGQQISLPVTKYEDAFEVNTTDLSPGLYIIRLSQASLKMIKQ